MRAAMLAGSSVALALALGSCLEPDRGVLATKDVDPPTLVETEPASGGVFDKDGFILITFSERMDLRSLRPGIWLQEGRDRVAVLVEVPPDKTGVPEATQQTDIPYTVRVSGEQTLKPNTNYTLVLNDVLTDTEGNQLVIGDGGTDLLISVRTGP